MGHKSNAGPTQIDQPNYMIFDGSVLIFQELERIARLHGLPLSGGENGASPQAEEAPPPPAPVSFLYLNEIRPLLDLGVP